MIYFRGDKIFWISAEKSGADFGDDFFGGCRTKIFEVLDISGNLYIESFGDFEFSMIMHFPSIITPLRNGKSIIYPQHISGNDRREKISFIEIEESGKTQGLNWSFINIPFNISDEADSGVWIFKV